MSRFAINSRGRFVALAIGAGAIASLATAPASFAAGAKPQPPAVGTNCQTDGKISGAGSTFQANEYNNALTYGFQQDVCGPVGASTTLNTSVAGAVWTADPSLYTAVLKQGAAGQSSVSVNGMIAYNYKLNGTGAAAKNGSGAGLNRISCRTDQFGGTDLPYSSTDLTNINGAPGAEAGGAANCASKLQLTTTPPPFYSGTNGSYPATGDQTKNAMSFPIGGGAVAIAVNLNGVCPAGTNFPTSINLTSDEFDKIMQGKINQWNDPELVATNPALGSDPNTTPAGDSCTGAIQRVVRQDNSGTTAITMQYLGAGDQGTNGIDTGTLCDGTNTWLALFQKNPNTTWPLGCTDANSNVAPNPIVGSSSANGGSPQLINTVETTNGSIGYAELGLWATNSPGGVIPAGVVFAGLESAAATTSAGLATTNPPAGSFISPGAAGGASSCNIGVLGLPGSGTVNESVGLGGVNDNWASDNTPATNKENITYQGSGYPNCGLTFDFVMTGMHNEAGEATPVTGASTTTANNSPEVGLTNDQLRTLYSFFTYAFSPLGQSNLDQATYDELPASWLGKLQSGFQNNF